MPYIRLPKCLVHFRWWKDTVKMVIKTVSSYSYWSYLLFGLFFLWSGPILHLWIYASPSVVLKYANNVLKGIVKRSHARLCCYDLMSEVYRIWEIKIPGWSSACCLKSKAVLRLQPFLTACFKNLYIFHCVLDQCSQWSKLDCFYP